MTSTSRCGNLDICKGGSSSSADDWHWASDVILVIDWFSLDFYVLFDFYHWIFSFFSGRRPVCSHCRQLLDGPCNQISKTTFSQERFWNQRGNSIRKKNQSNRDLSIMVARSEEDPVRRSRRWNYLLLTSLGLCLLILGLWLVVATNDTTTATIWRRRKTDTASQASVPDASGTLTWCPCYLTTSGDKSTVHQFSLFSLSKDGHALLLLSWPFYREIHGQIFENLINSTLFDYSLATKNSWIRDFLIHAILPKNFSFVIQIERQVIRSICIEHTGAIVPGIALMSSAVC